MLPTNETDSRRSTSEFVADTLRQEILRGDYAPGQALPQDHIAARFGVSQSSVREALRRLEALSLVDSFRNKGTFVSSLTPEQVEEIYEVRLAIELVALRSNFERIAPETLNDAERLLDSIESDREIAFHGELNKRFHAAFYKDSGKFVKDILQNVYGNLTRLWVDFVKRRPTLAHQYDQNSRREHRALLVAARNNDLLKAEAILTEHVRRARRTLLEHLREQPRVERRKARSAAPRESSGRRRTRVPRAVDAAGTDLALGPAAGSSSSPTIKSRRR